MVTVGCFLDRPIPKRSAIWHIEDVTEIWSASFSFPTVVFTVLLGIVGCLWLVSLVGLVDIELDAADGFLDDALEPFELSEVPTTILLTVFALAGWFVSVLASVFLLDSRSGAALVWLSIAIGLAAATVAIGVMLWLSPKLGRAFVTAEAPSKRELLGRIAEVRSATVTETVGRGEATWPDGTTSTVDLRTIGGTGIAPGELKRGDRAMLVDWDEESDDFFVDRVPSELID